MHQPFTTGQRHLLTICFATIATLTVGAAADAGDLKVETIASGLKGPNGVTVRPDAAGTPNEVLVADRGAGRIVQFGNGTPSARAEVISGFPIGEASAAGAPCAPGVQSIHFLDHARLVAAGGGTEGKPFLRLYDLSESENTLKAEEHKQDLDLSSIASDPKFRVLCFHDVARTQPNDRVPDMLLMATAVENGSAELWKVPVRANTIGEGSAFKLANNEDKIVAVNGIAVGNDGYIVVACRSDSDTDKSAALKYMNPIDGRIALSLAIKLPHVVALAYHPKSGNLYAANLDSSEKDGGIYRIDDASDPGKPVCNAVKIAPASRPTALAFAPDGTLYVTTLGDPDNDGKDAGTLLKLSGDL